MSTNSLPTRKRTEKLNFRASVEEKAGIEQRAAERNLPVGEYLIRVGLGRATRQRADVDAINLLRDCREQLKEIYHALQSLPDGGKLIPATTLDQQMAAITGAVLRVWKTGNDEE
jgi:hypothetical protein